MDGKKKKEGERHDKAFCLYSLLGYLGMALSLNKTENCN